MDPEGEEQLSPSGMLVSPWFSAINHFLWFPTDLISELLQVFKMQILRGLRDGFVGIESCHQD